MRVVISIACRYPKEADGEGRVGTGLFFFFFGFRERGREGEREGEKHQCKRETSIGCLHVALIGN